MTKKCSSIVNLVLVLLVVCFSSGSYAVTLLSETDALELMFPDVDEVITETVTLTAEEEEVIKERLGGSLVHYQQGSQSENVAESTEITFYIGMKNGEKTRIAIIDIQPGKWGPVDFIVAVDIPTSKVNNLAVMAYVEKRGRPIARKNFLKQFVGKSSKDAISVRSSKEVKIDIRAISGATISSDATCFSVKKVLAIFEEVYLKRLDNA